MRIRTFDALQIAVLAAALTVSAAAQATQPAAQNPQDHAEHHPEAASAAVGNGWHAVIGKHPRRSQFRRPTSGFHPAGRLCDSEIGVF